MSVSERIVPGIREGETFQEKLERLSETYEIRNLELVKKHLVLMPNLIGYLNEVQAEAIRRFPPPLRMAMEIYDFGPRDRILYAIVITGLERSRADEIFEAMDRDWWMPRANFLHDQLGFDMEYGKIDDD